MAKRIVQFGFKNHDPEEEGWSPVLDCRTLPNPYKKGVPDAELKQEVRRSSRFLSTVAEGVKLLEEHGILYVGCAFGKHRSGAVAEEIATKTGIRVELA